MSRPIPVLAGDGIGPLVIAEAVAVLQAVGCPRPLVSYPFGLSALPTHGTALPEATLSAVRAAGVALLGAATTPESGVSSPILGLRRALGLDLLLRPGAVGPQRHPILMVGHDQEGLYALPEDPGPPAIAQWRVSEAGADRLLAAAFARATRGVVVVDKPTVLRGAARLFREAAARHAPPGMPWALINADAAVAWLVREPERFDVIAATSFIADLLSDLIAALGDGIGAAPSASLGLDCAVFEPVHGSAPLRTEVPPRVDPTGAILAGVMMLEHLGEGVRARAIRRAVAEVRAAGIFAPGSTTAEVGAAVRERLD